MRKSLTSNDQESGQETKRTQQNYTQKDYKSESLQEYLRYSASRRFNLTLISEAEKTKTSELVYGMWSVIHPQSNFKRIWDTILILLLLYVAIIMPYRIAFIEGQAFDTWWWIDNSINFLFFCDLIINCCSAYYDENDRLVFKHKQIFLSYLKGWLLIDLISCLPFDLLLESSDGNSVKYNNLLRLFRLPRLYRLLRISKIFKLMQQYKNSEFLQKLQDFLNIKQSVARLIGVFFTVLVCVHIFACLWAFIPKLEGYELKTWVMRGGFYDDFQYILAIYWCIVTFSTVGYGDITPGTTFEILITIFWMIFGICFYSFIIGSLASILSSLETRY